MSNQSPFDRHRQHVQQHQQAADQQRAAWRRMNDDWDRQATAVAGGGEPGGTGDRIGLLIGGLVLVLLVGGSLFAWAQLRDGDAKTGTMSGQGQPGTDGGTGSSGVGAGSGSPGVDLVSVPDLVGPDRSWTDAVAELDRLGLRSVTAYGDRGSICSGDRWAAVIGLDPAAGSAVPPGTTVKVVATRVGVDDLVSLPDLVDDPIEEAERQLEVLEVAFKSYVPEGGTVPSQEPRECTRVVQNSDDVSVQLGEEAP